MTKTAQDLFKQSKTDWLDEARTAARQLLKARYSITIEDVLEVCPLPRYLHRNTTGSVFSHSDFKAIGYAKSRRTAMHSRIVRVWTERLPFEQTTEPEQTDELPGNWRFISPSRRLMEVE